MISSHDARLRHQQARRGRVFGCCRSDIGLRPNFQFQDRCRCQFIGRATSHGLGQRTRLVCEPDPYLFKGKDATRRVTESDPLVQKHLLEPDQISVALSMSDGADDCKSLGFATSLGPHFEINGSVAIEMKKAQRGGTLKPEQLGLPTIDPSSTSAAAPSGTGVTEASYSFLAGELACQRLSRRLWRDEQKVHNATSLGYQSQLRYRYYTYAPTDGAHFGRDPVRRFNHRRCVEGSGEFRSRQDRPSANSLQYLARGFT
ncbi:hypothetical protein CI41S_30520 [Bradyrhizobium ivorense]|nr:hypothetical protein CI41S_30520 [Bradyrhizobium ivorense]